MTTRVCVVGAGMWARAMHLPALRLLGDVEVTCVVAASKESAARVAAEFGVEHWYTDLETALRECEIDVVDIVAPPAVHAPAAIAAARHGKDVICIKPLARSVSEAEAMLSAAREAGTRLLYAENVPFIPAVRQAKEIVDSGRIGDVFRVKACEGIAAPHSDWFFDPETSGGGALIDMAVHSMEFCRYFAGGRVSTVYADTGTYVWGDRTSAEDTAVVTLRFTNGVIGQCEDSWSLTGAMDSRFEVFGTKGRVLIDNLHRQPLQVVSDSVPGGSSSDWSFPLPIPGLVADGHLNMLRHFVDCLRTGEPSLSEGEVGLRVLAVVEAATEAARTGIRQTIAPDRTPSAPVDGKKESTAS
ncbi:Gfo/Idh/MocA family oxidoreductase [Streptomyces sp. NPDC026672]|uniref:Gfo/Idh/MocA family protein n=1 Tax=unclassified Streptomyces TaxID=2593676 RepID=UPI0033C8BA82